MLIVIHQFKLCRGITAELAFGLTIKYGSMEVMVPLPNRPFFVNRDEVINQPVYSFRSGRKCINVFYHKTFPSGITDENGKVFPNDLDTLMFFSIERGYKEKGYFVVRQDSELESGIEIWRVDKGQEFPCSVDRNRK